MNKFMEKALRLAELSYNEGEVPVGAVVVKNGVVIGEGRNRRESLKSVVSHAEIEAIESACKKLNDWRLDGCDLYVTLEPCPMCAGAIINSRIKKVFFGAYDTKMGAVNSVVNLFSCAFPHKPEVYNGIMERECSEILEKFFKEIRNK